ncbi:MAG: hypothetical protein WCF23_24540 [Candidatus Nitrosopolaris sp.]
MGGNLGTFSGNLGTWSTVNLGTKPRLAGTTDQYSSQQYENEKTRAAHIGLNDISDRVCMVDNIHGFIEW